MNRLITRIPLPLAFLILLAPFALGQAVVYNDSGTLITGIWDENGIVAETADDTPYEGEMHYSFPYDHTANWSGFGLNLDNWGAAPPLDFSGYTHLSIAVRGMSGRDRVTVNLTMPDGTASDPADVSGPLTEYEVFEVPMVSFTAGGGFDLTQVGTIQVNVTGPDAASSGTFYFDDLTLVNKTTGSGASALTWSRFESNFTSGANLTNWLEARWLGDAYPDVDVFTEQDIINFMELGMSTIRMPVIFEYLASPDPPYTLDETHVAFSLVDSVITWADRHGATLIIDNHHGYPLSDANYEAEIPRKRAIWKQLAEKYAGLDHDQYYFEIYNEPTNQITNANFSVVANAVVEEIRAVDSDVTIIVGPATWNSRGALVSFTPLADDNIIYTFHSYEPYLFSHQGFSWTDPPNLPNRAFPVDASETALVQEEVKASKDWSDFYNVPIFLGEFGASVHADGASRCNYIETIGAALKEHDVPWIYWGSRQTDGFGFLNAAPDTDCFMEALGVGVGTSNEAPLSEVGLEVYPNPVVDELRLRFGSVGERDVRVYNGIGQLVVERRGVGPEMRVSAGDWAAGVYLVVAGKLRGVVVKR